MSASVECIVAIYAVPKMLAAIQAISALVTENASAEERIAVKPNAREIVDAVGNRLPVDLVLENGLGDKIGVRAVQVAPGEAPKPLEFVYANPESASACRTVDRIRQAYARLQVIDQLRKQGYKDVKEERLPNGSIRLVVQKWQ